MKIKAEVAGTGLFFFLPIGFAHHVLHIMSLKIFCFKSTHGTQSDQCQ